jgi:hypothetical protein
MYSYLWQLDELMTAGEGREVGGYAPRRPGIGGCGPAEDEQDGCYGALEGAVYAEVVE